MSDGTEDPRFQFVVYTPPAPGLPWLSVCLGPRGEVVGLGACASFEDAQRMRDTAAGIVAKSMKDETEGRFYPALLTAKH